MSSDKDIILPEIPIEKGSLHPINNMKDSIMDLLVSIGFEIIHGPEIETEEYNFDMLNIKESHPARQMHDTFYVNNKENVLRTHTSPVQIRGMLKNKPPLAFISGGKVYRKDDDATHLPMFHQVEGIYVDEEVTFSQLKDLIYKIIYSLFGEGVELRFRPSYFPFTEPSAEVDIGYEIKEGKIVIGEGNKWLEILGCGMVHPNVLKNVKVNPDEFQGYAFGIGIDRLAMLKYGINDLRAFFDCDYRWLNHFGFDPIDVPTNYRGLSR
jgi:phenylalanyl-tRNA synthetase alpha chain